MKYLILKSQTTDVNEYDIRFKLESADDASAVFAQYKAARENENQEEAQQLEALINGFLASQKDPNIYREPGENEPDLYKSARWVKDQITIYELERGEQAIPDEEIQRMLEVVNKADTVLKWYEAQWRGFLKNGRDGKSASEAAIHFDQLIDGFIEKASRPDYGGPRQDGQLPNLLLAARFVKEEIEKIKIQSGYVLSNGKIQLKVSRAEMRSAPGEEEPELPTTASLDDVMAARKAVEERSQAVRNLRHGLLSSLKTELIFKTDEFYDEGKKEPRSFFKEELIRNLDLFANDPAYPVENYLQFFSEKFTETEEMARRFRKGLTLEHSVNNYFVKSYQVGRRSASHGRPWIFVSGYLVKEMHPGEVVGSALWKNEEERLAETKLSEAQSLILPLLEEREGATEIDKATAKYISDNFRTMFEKKDVQVLMNFDQELRQGKPIAKAIEGTIRDALESILNPGETDFEIEYDRSEVRRDPKIERAFGRVNARILGRLKKTLNKPVEIPLDFLQKAFTKEGIALPEEKIERLQERIVLARKRPGWFKQDAFTSVSANRIPNMNRIHSVDQALSRLLSEIMPKNQMNTLGSDIPEGLTPAEMGEALGPLADKVNRFYAVFAGNSAVRVRQRDLPFANLSVIKAGGDLAKELSEIMERETGTGESPLFFTAVGGMDLSGLDDRLRQNVVELPVAQTDMPLILKQRAIRWGAELLMIRGELLKQNPDFLKPEVFKNYLEKYDPALVSLAQSFSVRNGFLRAEVSALVEQFTTEALLSTQA